MRLLQVVTTDSRLLDLHPQVSVVSDVDPATRAHLTSVVRGLARQEAVGQGLVEAHGILFDLEPDLLGLLAPGRADVDPVIRATDLPGLEVEDEPLLRARAAFADVLERLSAAVAAREGAQDELEAAASARAEAAEAVASATASLEAARQAAGRRQAAEQVATERAEAEAVAARRADEALQAAEAALAAAVHGRAEAEGRVAAASATVARLGAEREALQLEERQAAERLDEAGEAALGSAQEALAAIEADLAGARRREPGPAPPAGSGEEPERDLDDTPTPAALVARVALLDELLAELVELDRASVAEALDGLRTEPPLVSSSEAAALAEQLELVDPPIARVEATGPPEVTAEEAAAATERLERARAALADAEDAARSHAVDPQDAAELEAAHEALHDALERAEARVAGRRARGQVDRLRAEEQAVLDRLGFLSFAEYLMGTGAAHRDARAEAALAQAQAELEAAEAAADEVEVRRAAVLDHAARLEHRRQLLEAAAQLLGRAVEDGDDVVAALRDHRVPARSQAVQARELAGALAGVGVDVGDADELDPEDLALVAEAWLEEAAAAEDRRAELVATRADVEASLAALRAGGDGSSPSPPSEAGSGVATADGQARASATDDELRRARERAMEAVAAAEARVEAHATARAAVDAAAADRRLVEAALLDAEEEPRLAEDAQREAEEREAEAREVLAALVAEADARGPDLGADVPRSSSAPDALPDLDAARAALAAAEAALAAADEVHDRARRVQEATARELATLEAEGEAAAHELEGLEDARRAQGATGAATPDADELEWYLMARIAAQRSVTVAGSAPLLLDDPFSHLGDDDVHHLLGRLERMAETVQVIVVSDHPAVTAWAQTAGEARAAVVTPVAV